MSPLHFGSGKAGVINVAPTFSGEWS